MSVQDFNNNSYHKLSNKEWVQKPNVECFSQEPDVLNRLQWTVIIQKSNYLEELGVELLVVQLLGDSKLLDQKHNLVMLNDLAHIQLGKLAVDFKARQMM